MKLRPNVAVTLDITDVLSRSIVWYRGSLRSPQNRKIVIHNACAACEHTDTRQRRVSQRDHVDTNYEPTDPLGYATAAADVSAVSSNTGA